MRRILAAFLLALLSGCAHTKATVSTVEAEVKCDASSAIESGNYDWVNPHAAQSFLPNQCVEGKTKITIFHFGNDAPQHSDEVADAMDAEDCHPASWPHLLAVGADHPKLQLDQWPIVALGWSNRGFNPFLSGDGGSRGLGEAFFDGKCPACRFLAVCK